MEYSLKDRMILRIAIITTLLGLASLFLLMFFQTEKFVSAQDLSEYEGRSVTLSGRASNFSYAGNHTRFILVQECAVDVIAFNQVFNASDVIVTGKVQEYNGENSIIADRVVVTDGRK